MSNLVKYNAACRALAEARAVDEVKDLRDKADAMRIYAMQSKNKTLEVDAAEIRIRAERRLGELIIAQKETIGLNTGGNPKLTTAHPAAVDKPTLADVGISHKLSSRAQKMAAIPVEEFEAEVGEWRDRVSAENERVTVRLGHAGDRAQSVAEPEPEYFGPTEEEIARDEKAASDQADYIKKLLSEEDNPLTKALFDLDLMRKELLYVKRERDGFQNKTNELIRTVKGLQFKISKMGRAA